MTEVKNIIHRITDSWHRLVWQKNLKNTPFLERFIFQSLRIVSTVLRDLADGQLSLRAMSLVYTTVISLVPLLAISFSVLKGFGAHNQIRPMLLNVMAPMGEKGREIADKIIGFVDNIQVGVLGTVGLALLIYSVISMMQKIEKSFNYTWHISRGRSMAQRFSDYLSVLLVGPLLIFLSVGITASLQTNVLESKLSSMPVMGEVLEVLGLIVPYFLMAAGFAFIYSFIPNTRVKLGSAFIAGLVTAVIWKSMGLIFSEFIAGSSSHTLVYSAFAALIIFMVWLYLGWLVLLIGASIAFYHQHPHNMQIEPEKLVLSNRMREVLGLEVMLQVARQFQKNQGGCNVDDLSERCGTPVSVTDRIIEMLQEVGFLTASQEQPTLYTPARPLENLSLSELFESVRRWRESRAITLEDVTVSKPAQEQFAKLTKAREDALAKVSLRDLVV